MIDAICDLRAVLSQRIIRELGQMNDGVEALKVAALEQAQVTQQGSGRDTWCFMVEIKAAIPVEASVKPRDSVAAGLEPTRQTGADVSLCTGDKHVHDAMVFAVGVAALRHHGDEGVTGCGGDPSGTFCPMAAASARQGGTT
jgi:hypothetical protein